MRSHENLKLSTKAAAAVRKIHEIVCGRWHLGIRTVAIAALHNGACDERLPAFSFFHIFVDGVHEGRNKDCKYHVRSKAFSFSRLENSCRLGKSN